MKLDNKCENLSNSLKKYKEDLNHYKIEKSKAEKELKNRKIKKLASVSTNTNTSTINMGSQTPSSMNLNTNSSRASLDTDQGCRSTPSSQNSSMASTSSKVSHPTSPCSTTTMDTMDRYTATTSFSTRDKTPDSPKLTTSVSSTKIISSKTSSDASTSSVPLSNISSTCLHIPQCKMRNPNPPPPFAPITFEQFYYPPKPPAKIKILPSQRLSYTQFCHLEQVSHKCEECEEGMLFHTYSERVEYDDPGPCGGVSATYLRACPNSPNAQISFSSHCEVDQKSYRFKKLCVKCDVCGKIFDKLGHLSFHMNRKHAGKE